MKRIIPLTLIFTAFILSCSNRTAENKNEEVIKYVELKHINTKIPSDSLHDISGLSIYGNFLFAEDETRKYYFAVFSIQTGELLFRFGKKGIGPGEINMPIFGSINYNENCFDVTGIQPKGVIQYPLDKLFLNRNKTTPNIISITTNDPIAHANISFKGTDYIISLGNYEQGQYALFSKTGKFKKITGKFPVEKGLEDVSQFNIGGAYQGKVVFKPGSNRFAYCSMVGSIFEICEIDENDSLIKLKKKYEHYPKFKTFGYNTAILPDNIMGYNSLTLSKNYIYSLYSKKTVEEARPTSLFLFNEILVFNWEGELIKKYKTDIPMRDIAVSQNDDYIMATTLDTEPRIVKFNLK